MPQKSRKMCGFGALTEWSVMADETSVPGLAVLKTLRFSGKTLDPAA